MQSGKVTGREIKKNKDGLKKVILLQVEVTSSEDIQSVELMNQTGEDNNPPNDSRLTIIDIGQAFKIAIASDDNIDPITDPGEKRIYSTDEDNLIVKSSILMKNDGTIIANNDEITITAHSSGKLEIVTSGNSEITSAKTIINNDVDIFGNVNISQNLVVVGNITGAIITALTNLFINSLNILLHKHTGVSSGTETSGGPTN